MSKHQKMAHESKKDTKKLESSQVRYTGDWSSDSKLSAINNGYWEDPFFRFFNKTDPQKIRRTSLICRGYYVRFRVCDYFLRSILRSSSTPMQVVSLGCGMDTSFFRLLPELENKISSFYELDFKSVITAKKSMILHSEVLRLMAMNKLFLLSCDLRKIESLHEAILHAKFDFEKPTLFYSECVVNYLRPIESTRILRWITANIPNAVWLAYEQCYPHDAFGQIMVSHFMKNGCPLLSLLSTPDPNSQQIQLGDSGFESCHIFNAWDSFLHIGNEYPPHFPDVSKSQQQFDEYSALIATCLHYTVRIGCIGRLALIKDFLKEMDKKIFYSSQKEATSESIIQTFTIDKDRLNNEEFSLTVNDLSNMPRLTGSVSVVCTETNKILTFGGCGEDSLRMKHLIETQLNFEDDSICDSDPVITSRIIAENPLYYERIHSQAVYIPPTSGMDNSGNQVYIFGGRKSPRSACKNNLICLNIDNIEECKEASSFVVPGTSSEDQEQDLTFPEARWRFGMVLYYQKGFPILVLFGGRNVQQVLGDCWCFSILKSEWMQQFDIKRQESDNQPSPRHSHSMVSDVSLGHIFVVGGVSSDDTTLCKDAFWEYRWEWRSWKNIPSYNKVSRRMEHSLEIHKRKIYIVGGYAADSFSTLNHFITIIDLESTVIKTYNYNFFPDHRFLPFGFSTCLLTDSKAKDTRIIIFGGGGNCFSFGTHLNKVCAVLTLK